MNGLLAQVDHTIQSGRLLRQGQPVLVAVSGGLDSTVLLHLLHQLSRAHRWKLTVAHFNHQLRGRSSNADERLVVRTAARLNLPVRVGRADVRGFAQAQRLSLEMAARALRHRFLARLARRRNTPTVALAHHADDQQELFFLRLLRGSGSQGLAGMRWRGPSPSHPGIELIRPLLDQPKAALRAYALEHRVRYREDASNARLDIQRNQIRHRLLPLLRREYRPALDQTLLRSLEILGAEADLVEQLASDWLRQARAASRARRRVTRTPGPFARLPLALQRRALQMQLVESGISPDFELVEKLRLHANQPMPCSPRASGRLSRAESSGLSVVRDHSGLVRPHTPVQPNFNQDRRLLDLHQTRGEVTFGGLRLHWQIASRKGSLRHKTAPNTELFDADRVGPTVLLRHWQPGDRFQPIGMKCAVKLQDLFTNLKVPRLRRRAAVVAVSATGEPFWVEGLRLAEGFKLRHQTNRRLRWWWRRL